jgi:hypothetical protein
MTDPNRLTLSDDDLRELFALFSSPTDHEVRQVFDSSHSNFYKREELNDEYSLTQEKREFAVDAWRAVTYFLHRKGFKLYKDGREFDLSASSVNDVTS